MKTRLVHVIAIAATVALAACQEPEIQSEGSTAGGLAPVEHSGMTAAQADASANFASYRNVAIQPLGFSHLEVLDPGYDMPRYKHFTITEKDIADLRKMYYEKVSAALTKDGSFTISETAGPGSLALVTEMVRLEPNAPREQDERFTSSARNRTYTKGAGSMTLEAQLIDTASGKVVATLKDKMTDDEIWEQNNPVSNRAAVQRGFSEWGMKLRRQLLAFRGEKG